MSAPADPAASAGPAVAHAVGTALAALGVKTVFGVVGSGNFHVTNALTAAGARFVAARHEGGAAVMADAYARVSGELGVLSVHQGPGLTNAMTGIGRGSGCAGVTVTSPEDLAAVADWVTGPRDRPMVVDAKVTRSEPSWWLAEAFRGH